MKVVCSWCSRLLADKEPHDDPRTTHSICPKCAQQFFSTNLHLNKDLSLEKIISGGQTGADRTGLNVAKKLGLATGGWMPKGYRALDGNHPEFAGLYNVQEHSSPTYPPRTYANVYGSDGTVRFAARWTSPGELCTLAALTKSGKPHFDVDILGITAPADLTQWLVTNKIKILNVAGNSETTCPGISEFVEAFLMEALTVKN
jgi:hypothetical protein